MNTLDYDFGVQDNLLANDDFAEDSEDDTEKDLEDPEETLPGGDGFPEEEPESLE